MRKNYLSALFIAFGDSVVLDFADFIAMIYLYPNLNVSVMLECG